ATSNEVVMLDADTGVELARAGTAAEPTSVALLPGYLVVASRKSHHLEAFPRELGKSKIVRLRPEQPDLRGTDFVGVDHLVPARGTLVGVATVAKLGDPAQPTYYGSFNASPFEQELFVLGGDLEAKPAGIVQLP